MARQTLLVQLVEQWSDIPKFEGSNREKWQNNVTIYLDWKLARSVFNGFLFNFSETIQLSGDIQGLNPSGF